MSDLCRSAPVRSYARIALSIGVAALATQLVGCGKKAAVDEELAAKLTEPVARVELVAAKQREVEKATSRLAKEKQFNRKVEINAHLRQLKVGLQELSL